MSGEGSGVSAYACADTHEHSPVAYAISSNSRELVYFVIKILHFF